MKPLLSTHELQALSEERRPLSKPLNLELFPGEVLFISGENGAGKSSLLKTLLGLHPFYQGRFSISCDHSEIQYLPQLGSLAFQIPMNLNDMLPVASPLPLLQNVDLRKKWNSASGGERQKVLLAAALMQKPRLLILDEPFNHVDKESAVLSEKSLQDFLRDNPQSSLILVSHRSLVHPWAGVRFLELQ